MKTVIYKILRKLNFLDQQNGRRGRVRKDVEIIPIQPNLELIVYWKVLKIGKGPALILKAYTKEVLKFDCFGRNDGHYHVAPNYEERIFFEEQTLSTQIERTLRELKENTQGHLRNQPEEKIQTIEIDKEKFSKAIELAKIKMIQFLESVPELKELR